MTKATALKQILKKEIILMDVPHQFQTIEIIMAGVKNNGMMLKYAVMQNPKIVQVACASTPNAIEFAHFIGPELEPLLIKLKKTHPEVLSRLNPKIFSSPALYIQYCS